MENNQVAPIFELPQESQEQRFNKRDLILAVTTAAVILIVVVLLGFRLGVAAQIGAAAIGTPKVGTPAPDFTLPTTGGEIFSLAEAEGRPVWLTFWATWCPPCREEMPDLQETYNSQQSDRYRYLAVNFGEETSAVKGYVNEIGYTLPVGLDPAAITAMDYGVLNLPTHFFIDANGIVREVYAGALSHAQIEQRVAELW